MSVDDFRIMTICLTLLSGLLFPWAIYHRTQTRAALLVVVVLVINFVGASVAIADSFGDPLVWYRTPRIFVADVLALIYCGIAWLPPPPAPPSVAPRILRRTRTKEAHHERAARDESAGRPA